MQREGDGMPVIKHEIQTITFSEGTWARSEFPHPLVTLDFDADGNLLAVSAPGIINGEAVSLASEAADLLEELTVYWEIDQLPPDVAGRFDAVGEALSRLGGGQ
jgi:hypothetical protein